MESEIMPTRQSRQYPGLHWTEHRTPEGHFIAFSIRDGDGSRRFVYEAGHIGSSEEIAYNYKLLGAVNYLLNDSQFYCEQLEKSRRVTYQDLLRLVPKELQ